MPTACVLIGRKPLTLIATTTPDPLDDAPEVVVPLLPVVGPGQLVGFPVLPVGFLAPPVVLVPVAHVLPALAASKLPLSFITAAAPMTIFPLVGPVAAPPDAPEVVVPLLPVVGPGQLVGFPVLPVGFLAPPMVLVPVAHAPMGIGEIKAPAYRLVLALAAETGLPAPRTAPVFMLAAAGTISSRVSVDARMRFMAVGSFR